MSSDSPSSGKYPSSVYNLILATAVFGLVVFFHYFFRLDVLNTSMLIRDDIQIFSASLNGPIKEGVYFWLFSFINQTFGSLYNIRLFYIVVIGLCAFQFYFVCERYFSDKLLSLIVSVSVFVSPHTLIFAYFINGSYQILFLLVHLASFILVVGIAQVSAKKLDFLKLGFAGFGISGLVWLQLEFGSGMILVPFLLCIYLLLETYASEKQRLLKWRWFLAGLVVSIFALVLRRYFELATHHPYSAMSERISYEPADIAYQLLLFLLKVPAVFFEQNISYTHVKDVSYFLETGPVLVVLGCLTLLLVVLAKGYRESGTIKNIFVMSVAIGLSSIVYATVNVHHQWYFQIAFMFASLLTFYCLKFLGNWLSYTLALLFLFVSVSAFESMHEPFEHGANDQENLKAFLSSHKDNWEPGSSIFVKVDGLPYMFNTRSVSRRAKSFVAFSTDRADIENATIDSKLSIPYSQLESPSYFYRFSFRENRGEEITKLLRYDSRRNEYVLLSNKGSLVASIDSESSLEPQESFDFFTESQEYLDGKILLIGPKPKHISVDPILFDREVKKT